MPDKLEACRCLMFQNLANLINPAINQVVEFAKRVPGKCVLNFYFLIF